MCKILDTHAWNSISRLMHCFGKQYWCSDGLNEKIACLTEIEKAVIQKTYDLWNEYIRSGMLQCNTTDTTNSKLLGEFAEQLIKLGCPEGFKLIIDIYEYQLVLKRPHDDDTIIIEKEHTIINSIGVLETCYNYWQLDTCEN